MLFYRKCYEIDPDREEGKLRLLDSLLNSLSHSEHSWPKGILYGMNGATLAECHVIRETAQFALSLAIENRDQSFIASFLEKLDQYELKLTQNSKTSAEK